jgi:hypothetical protein
MVYVDYVAKTNNTTFSTKDVDVEVDVIKLMEDVFKFVQI